MTDFKALKNDRMTSEERMTALLKGNPIDRVPLYHFILGFCARNTGSPLDVIYKDPGQSFQVQSQTLEQYGFDGGPDYGYASYGGWEFGGDIKFPSGEYEQGPTHGGFLVQSEDDVWNLKLPEVKTAGFIPLAMEFSKLQDKSGKPVSIVLGGNFTIAGNICPVATLCRWILKKPELVHRIMELTTEHVVQVIQYWADTFGAERIVPNLWEPLATNDIISPWHFKEYVFPYIKESSEKILATGIKHIYYHVCGDQNLNLPYWAEIPTGNPGLISVGHQISLTDAIKYFGNNNVIIGNVDGNIIRKGSARQVYEHCQKCIEEAKFAPRGYMLMSGCEIPPMSPPANVYAMRKAINDFGWY